MAVQILHAVEKEILPPAPPPDTGAACLAIAAAVHRKPIDLVAPRPRDGPSRPAPDHDRTRPRRPPQRLPGPGRAIPARSARRPAPARHRPGARRRLFRPGPPPGGAHADPAPGGGPDRVERGGTGGGLVGRTHPAHQPDRRSGRHPGALRTRLVPAGGRPLQGTLRRGAGGLLRDPAPRAGVAAVLPGRGRQGAGAQGPDHPRRARARARGGDGLRGGAGLSSHLRLRPHHQPPRRGPGRPGIPPPRLA